MKRMSGGAILVFVVFVFAAIVLKRQFFDYDGAVGIAVSAGAGAFGGLIGMVLGTKMFPKKGDEND